MRAPLRLAVAQPSCISHDVAANAAAHADAIRRAEARVVVFPELSITGYEYDALPVAIDDPRLEPIVDACRETNAIALVGAPVDGPRIGMLGIDGAGVHLAYTKNHIASSEQPHFIAGNGPVALDVDGWSLGLAICFDTCNPSHPAEYAAMGVDAYVAGVLDSPEELWTQDERITNIVRDHGIAVAFASFAGTTGAGFKTCAGRSRVVGRDGTVLASAGTSPGEVVTATLPP